MTSIALILLTCFRVLATPADDFIAIAAQLFAIASATAAEDQPKFLTSD